jgi:hypothetical protein
VCEAKAALRDAFFVGCFWTDAPSSFFLFRFFFRQFRPGPSSSLSPPAAAFFSSSQIVFYIRKNKRRTEMSYRLSNVSRHMARFMRTPSSSTSSSARGSSNSSSFHGSSSSSRQKQISCNNNNGFGIVSRPTNSNTGIGSLRQFADLAAAQKNSQQNARVVAFALEALKFEAARTTATTNLNLVDLDEIVLSTDSIGLFEEIEDT